MLLNKCKTRHYGFQAEILDGSTFNQNVGLINTKITSHLWSNNVHWYPRCRFATPFRKNGLAIVDKVLFKTNPNGETEILVP